MRRTLYLILSIVSLQFITIHIFAADSTDWIGVKTLVDFDQFEQRLFFRPDLENVFKAPKQENRMINGTYLVNEQEIFNRGENQGKHPIYLSPAYRVTVEEMGLENWIVELNPSAKKVENVINSYCRKLFLYLDAKGQIDEDRKVWPQPRNKFDELLQEPLIKVDWSKPDATPIPGDIELQFAGVAYDPAKKEFSVTTTTTLLSYEKGEFKQVLGIRIHFPDHWFNAWARVRPPHEIAAYQLPRKGAYGADRYIGITGAEVRNVGNGVLFNTGDMIWIRAKLSGRNFKHGIAIRLKDQNDKITEHFLGYLNYAGWRVLEWNNPDYIASETHRTYERVPLYPKEMPYKKFDSFIIYRHGAHDGGDFILYIEKIWANHDLGVSPNILKLLDTKDEHLWKIITKKTFKRADEDAQKRADELDLKFQHEGIISEYNDDMWKEYVNK